MILTEAGDPQVEYWRGWVGNNDAQGIWYVYSQLYGLNTVQRTVALILSAMWGRGQWDFPLKRLSLNDFLPASIGLSLKQILIIEAPFLVWVNLLDSRPCWVKVVQSNSAILSLLS